MMKENYEEFIRRLASDLRAHFADTMSSTEGLEQVLRQMVSPTPFIDNRVDANYEDLRDQLIGFLSSIKKEMSTNRKRATLPDAEKAMNAINTEDVASKIDDYAQMKTVIFPRALNLGRHRERLAKGGVYRVHGDIALTLYALAAESSHTLSSFMLPEKLLENWGVSREEIWTQAITNAMTRYPARLLPIEAANQLKADISGDLPNTDLMDLTGGYHFRPSAMKIYALTDSRRVNGATALFYPGVCRRIAELFGENFYCLPASISEVLIHPFSTISKKMVLRGVEVATRNNPFNSPENVLSHHAFLYHADTDSLEMLSRGKSHR